MILRFLKWVIAVVLFRKVGSLIQAIIRQLGFKGLAIVSVVVWVVSMFLGRC